MEWEDFPPLYQGRRRTGYEDTVVKMRTFGMPSNLANVATFTKTEKINFTVKKDPNPRIIQPRTRAYNVLVGCYIKPSEALYCKTVAKIFGSRTIVKGLNADEVGRLAEEKWRKFDRPVAVGMDAKAFDEHVNVDLLKFEHELYVKTQSSIDDRRRLAALLKMQLRNVCSTFIGEYRVKYAVDGRRMSGDMNTGTGNSLIMSASVWTYCRDAGITKFELLNNGDDCVLIVEQDDLHRLNNVTPWFKELGLNMVVEEPVYELEKIDFCQSNFLKVNGRYRQVRKPSFAICKDSVSTKPFHVENDMRAWLSGVGEGGLALNSGVPVLQSFYTAYMRAGKGVKPLSALDPTMETGTRMLTRGMDSKTMPVTPEARLSFWLATGCLPDEQILLERHYDNLTIAFKPTHQTFPVLNLI